MEINFWGRTNNFSYQQNPAIRGAGGASISLPDGLSRFRAQSPAAVLPKIHRFLPIQFHEISRFSELRCHPRFDVGGQRCHHLAAPAAGQGRAGYRQDHAGRRSSAGARYAAAAMAYQIDHQGAAGSV